MDVQASTRKCPHKRECEDAFVVNEEAQIYGVFDGVTPMVEYADECGHNGAYIAANLFRSHFAGLASVVDLNAELERANRILSERMKEAGVDMMIRHGLWSTCAAVVQVGEDAVSFAQLGDCMIAAQDRQGEVKVLTRDQVQGIRLRAAAKRAADRERGIYTPDESFFSEGFHRMAYNRWMANTPEGYGVANGMPEMGRYIQSGVISRGSLRHLLIVSDGLFDEAARMESVLRQVLEMGLENYIIERQRLEMGKGIHSDDKTGILISF